MKEIKCPNCGTVITVDDADFAAILNQVRTEEFDAEVNRRIEETKRLLKAEEAKKQALEAAEAAKEAARLDARHKEDLSKKEMEIEKLRQQIAGWEQGKALELEAARLKAEQKAADALNQKETELRKKEEEISRLITDAANERKNAAERVQALLETHKVEKESLEKEVELYRNFKQKRSVKLLGEDLEQHCYTLYNQTLLPVMPNATFLKDNAAVKDGDETKGSKGDFIFRDKEDGVEYISIMFDMKNESDDAVNKKKNADFFDKLDKDRKKKDCEFAVLVSMLEMDNDLYNNGIVSVPGYEKMYVVRPDNFIPIITLLVQTSKKALSYKKELAVAKNQSVDLSKFEDQLLAFKDGFSKNVANAKKKYDEAIKGIDTTIETLSKIKESLRISATHLTAANNKADDLTIRKLTYNNPTVKAGIEEARAKKAQQELEQGPDEQ
ncbi:MAG: DUF2130 domain-containing protein [Bacteroidales bacterium]|nr:DUF2130 domain-containing protein [Bacteroidales bacterium]